uniref:Ald_Xan_dh_C2 domain-containing protein n=1 Tax=Rhodnius prolixus TaxID=13249 RepID=T1HPY0_RHOPR
MVAAAGAVAAYNLNQPVRVVLDLTTNMRAIGKRYPLLAKYDLGVNDDGLVQNLKLDIYENSGYSENDDITEITEKGIPSIYDITSWKVNIYLVKTDIPCTTWMRAPGMLEGITTADHIMEHIAFIVKKDPVEICRLNCNPDDRSVFDEMLQTIKTSSDYVNRRALVDQFNKDNRWKKKGISLVPMKFTIKLFPNFYSLVSIYAGDGTVAISSGGVEMGQGLNTKVAQVAAHTLGIDLDMVKIDPTICIISPNSYGTAASTGSEIISY